MSSNIRDIYFIIGRGQGKNQFIEILERFAEERAKQSMIMDEYASAMSNIQLTNIQKEAINKLSAVFGEFSEHMINVMNELSISNPTKLSDLQEVIYPPTMDYTQKHKPWKKDKFYY